MQHFFHTLTTLRFGDILDIGIVTLLVYMVLAFLRDTRSSAILRGVGAITVAGLSLYLLAHWLNLYATRLLFERLWIVIMLGLMIVFQNELRKALTEFGQLRVFRRFLAQGGLQLDEVIKAVRTFSKQKVGALICIERRDNLSSYAKTGTELDAAFTSELLRTVFMAYSPLHDGAVILRGERLLAAGCILPLSDDPTLSKELGTRHRAGMGLCEETDAVVVIVSEETGIISLAVDGRLERHHTPDALHQALEELLDVAAEPATAAAR